MRIQVTEIAVVFSSRCHVPGCEREVEASLPMERLEELQQEAKGADAILGRIIGGLAERIVGFDREVEDVEELPPIVCPRHAATLALVDLEELEGAMVDGSPPRPHPENGDGGTFDLADDDEEGDDGE